MTVTEQVFVDDSICLSICIMLLKLIGGVVRNCGFMWEPGAYAGILIFMIVYHLFSNSFKLDWKIMFLTLCVITTYSTAGYLAFFCVIILYFYYNHQLYQKHRAIIPAVLLSIFLVGYSLLYENTDFWVIRSNVMLNKVRSRSRNFQGEHELVFHDLEL